MSKYSQFQIGHFFFNQKVLIFFLFFFKNIYCVVCTHLMHLNEALLMSTHNKCLLGEIRKTFTWYPLHLELWIFKVVMVYSHIRPWALHLLKGAGWCRPKTSLLKIPKFKKKKNSTYNVYLFLACAVILFYNQSEDLLRTIWWQCWYKFSYFSIKSYVVGTHYKRLAKALLMSTDNIYFYGELEKTVPELSSNTPP